MTNWLSGKSLKLLPPDVIFKAKMHQIRFPLGLRPPPADGAYGTPPTPLVGFKGPTSKGEERKGGSMLMTLNCTSLYHPQILRLQSPGSNLSHRTLPLAFTQRPLSESYKIGCCSVWYSAKAPRISTYYIHQHRMLCCTSL